MNEKLLVRLFSLQIVWTPCPSSLEETVHSK